MYCSCTRRALESLRRLVLTSAFSHLLTPVAKCHRTSKSTHTCICVGVSPMAWSPGSVMAVEVAGALASGELACGKKLQEKLFQFQL